MIAVRIHIVEINRIKQVRFCYCKKYGKISIEVSLSPTFYAWVFQFGGAIKILTPEKAVNEITEMAKRLTERE